MTTKAPKKKRKSLRPENLHLEISHEDLHALFEKSNFIEQLEAQGVPFEEAVKQADEKFGD